MKESETGGFYCSPRLQITANVLHLKVSAPIISTVLANTSFISRSKVDNIKEFEANINLQIRLSLEVTLDE